MDDRQQQKTMSYPSRYGFGANFVDIRHTNQKEAFVKAVQRVVDLAGARDYVPIARKYVFIIPGSESVMAGSNPWQGHRLLPFCLTIMSVKRKYQIQWIVLRMSSHARWPDSSSFGAAFCVIAKGEIGRFLMYRVWLHSL